MRTDTLMLSLCAASFKNKTLGEYKNTYSDSLDSFLKENIDNDEISFVKREIILIKAYIKPIVKNKKTDLEKKGIIDFEVNQITFWLSSYEKIIDFLENKLIDLLQKKSLIHEKETEIDTEKTNLELDLNFNFKITLKHIALKAYYNNTPIFERNAEKFLEDEAQISTKKLVQHYSFFNNAVDRIANPESKIMLKNKIKLFEEVRTMLPVDKRGKISDEIIVLKNFMSCY